MHNSEETNLMNKEGTLITERLQAVSADEEQRHAFYILRIWALIKHLDDNISNFEK